MPRTPSMFGTFSVTVDVSDELSRSTDTLHLQRDARKPVHPYSCESPLSVSRLHPSCRGHTVRVWG